MRTWCRASACSFAMAWGGFRWSTPIRTFAAGGLAERCWVHAGRHALDEMGATDLVVTADADGVAKDLYQSVGFATTEWLTDLTLVEATSV